MNFDLTHNMTTKPFSIYLSYLVLNDIESSKNSDLGQLPK